MFSVIHASRQATGEDTTIEIVENRPFVNEGGLPAGQYTHKIYHISKRLPAIVRAVAPENMLKIDEYSWNAFPKISMILTNQFLGSRFEIRIESMHLPDRGESENASFKLSQKFNFDYFFRFLNWEKKT